MGIANPIYKVYSIYESTQQHGSAAGAEYGWTISSYVLSMKWDTEGNMKTMKDRLHIQTEGASVLQDAL